VKRETLEGQKEDWRQKNKGEVEERRADRNGQARKTSRDMTQGKGNENVHVSNRTGSKDGGVDFHLREGSHWGLTEGGVGRNQRVEGRAKRGDSQEDQTSR